MSLDRPPLSPAEAALPVTRGVLRDELATAAGTLRAEAAAQTETLRTELSALREDLREEIHASEARTRVLLEETHSMLQIVLERLSDAIGGNAQIARLDTALAGVRHQAAAAASLAPRVNDHERRIAALEGRS